MRSTILNIATTAFAVASSVSCGNSVDCSSNALYSLQITVVDAQTGARLCDATVTARDGTFVEGLSCTGGPECRCHGVLERPAKYEVTAVKSGYQSNTITVVAGQDECHVTPAYAEIKLTHD